MLLAGKPLRLVQYVVKFAVLGTCQECVDLRLSVEQDRADREPRVPHGDLAARQRGQLHARPVGITVLALLPVDVAQFARWHAVVRRDHRYPLPTPSTHPDPKNITRCYLDLASGKDVPEYVSVVWWSPVRLYGDLCTERMNVHLVLHLHILSGSMSLSTP